MPCSRRWFVGLSALLTLPPACNPTEDPAPKTEASATAKPLAEATASAVSEDLLKVGATAEHPDYNFTLLSVRECKPKRGQLSDKRRLLGLEVLLESKADRQFYASSAHAKIEDRKGTAHNAKGALDTRNCNPLLKGIRLTQAEKTAGFLVFDLPADATGLTLSYNPVFYGEPQISKFDLGR